MRMKIGMTICTIINILVAVLLCCLSSAVVDRTWWTIIASMLTAVVVCEDLKDLYKLIKYNK